MSTADLNIRVRVSDDGSIAIDKVAGKLRTLSEAGQQGFVDQKRRFADLERALFAADAQARRMAESSGILETAFKRMGAAAAAYLSFQTVSGMAKEFVTAAAQVEKTEVMLRRLYGTASNGHQAFGWLRDFSAQGLPVEMKAVQDAFVKLKTAGIEPMGGSLQSLVDAVVAFGGTGENLQRAAVAIQQMAGKGVISMEELRQQLGEAIPTAGKIMARELDMSMSDFVKKVSTGGVSAKEGLEALFRGMEKDFAGASAAMADTWKGRMASLGASWERFASTVGTSIITNDSLLSFLGRVERTLDRLEKGWAWLDKADKEFRADEERWGMHSDLKLYANQYIEAKKAYDKVMADYARVEGTGYNAAGGSALADRLEKATKAMKDAQSGYWKTLGALGVASAKGVPEDSWLARDRGAPMPEDLGDPDAARKTKDASQRAEEHAKGVHRAFGEVGYLSDAFVADHIAEARRTAELAGEKGVTKAERERWLEGRIQEIWKQAGQARFGKAEGSPGLWEFQAKEAPDVQSRAAQVLVEAEEASVKAGEALKDSWQARAEEAEGVSTREAQALLDLEKEAVALGEKLTDSWVSGAAERAAADTRSIEESLAAQKRGLEALGALSRTYVEDRQDDARALAEVAVEGGATREEAERFLARRFIEIDKEYYQARLEAAQSYQEAIAAGLKGYALDAEDTFSTVGRSAVSAFQTLENDLVESLQRGKVSFKDFADYSLGQLYRIAVQSAITGPLAGIVGGLFGGGASAQSKLAGGSGPITSGPVMEAHTGGVVGVDTFKTRTVPTSLFDFAPRYHTGRPPLAPGERAAIVKDEEGIFTPGQMAALGSRTVQITMPVTIEAGGGGGEFDEAHAGEIARSLRAAMDRWAVENKRPGGLLYG